MSEGERKYTGFAAIYQLEQEKLKREKSSEQPDERTDEVSTSPVKDRLDQQLSSPEAQRDSATTSRVESDNQETRASEIASPKSSLTPQPATTTGRRAASPRSGRTTSAPRPALAKAATAENAGSVTDSTVGTIESHTLRWKQVYRLNKGEINVMKVMFGLTYEHGQSECYIKVPEVAEAAQLKKRRCQYVIRGLEALGFLERLEDYDPSKRLGTKYRVYLKPSRTDS